MPTITEIIMEALPDAQPDAASALATILYNVLIATTAPSGGGNLTPPASGSA